MSPLGQTIAEILKMTTEENQYDSKRFLSLLDDLAPELTSERKIFHRIITDDILSQLINISIVTGEPGTEMLRLKKRLEDEYGLVESWSVLIISSFADAFNIKFEYQLQEATPVHETIKETSTQNINYLPDTENNVSLEQEQKRNALFKQKELLQKEKSSLGLFSLKRKSEIEKQLSDIDAQLSSTYIVYGVNQTNTTCISNSKAVFQINKLETFASDGTISGKKLTCSDFFRTETSYIGIKIHFNKENCNRIANLSWKIYNENGTAFSTENKISIPVTPNDDSVFQQWGWKEVGKWPLGRYCVVASINGCPPVQLWFEIKNGRYDVLPTRIKSVKLFNGGIPAPQIQQREYTSIFSKSSSRIIYFQFAFDPPGYDVNTLFECYIKHESGKIIANVASPIAIGSNHAFYWNGYGWENPGGWAAGKYTYTVSLGKCQPVTGTFIVN